LRFSSIRPVSLKLLAGRPDVLNVYQFSRAIFRELRPYLATEEAQSAVLAASEDMVERLAYGTAPRRPARELFRTVRVHIGLESQLRVRCVIDHYLGFAQDVCEERGRKGLDAFGTPLPCGATTRNGTQCARPPVDGTGYCPSHRHLGEVLVA
jgi:hypothetical protein